MTISESSLLAIILGDAAFSTPTFMFAQPKDHTAWRGNA
jgi:hypothetical protein